MKKTFLIFILVLCALSTLAQDIVVKSRVVDASTGDAMPYVSVYVNERSGAITNHDGDFSISVAPDDILRISYVGYEKRFVKASDLGSTIKLVPMESTMLEVNVRSWTNMLNEVSNKLSREYWRRRKVENQYFCRLHTSFRTHELTEAFVEAKSASNLRDISILKGFHGRLVGDRITAPMIAEMNFHHPFELGPMTQEVYFWQALITPLGSRSSVTFLNKHYNISGVLLTDSTGLQIYRFDLKKKPKANPIAILTGSLYVDAKSLQVLRFEGKVEDTWLDIKKDMRVVSSPIDLNVHINYRHDKGFTQVSDISTLIQCGDFRSQSVLYSVDDVKIEVDSKRKKKKKTAADNLLSSINEAGYDDELWRSSNIMQRTAEEERALAMTNTHKVNIAEELAKAQLQDDEPKTNRGTFGDKADPRLEKLTERLELFGKNIPQEKVYLHMDNTCYFLGDTIWFAAYSRRTNDGKPSNISGVLYVELYNQDGYMMERKLIEMRNGRGHGNFALKKDFYGGFYELRAYTRWQLNWGQYEHFNATVSKEWFLSNELHDNYYRDYDKIYSRVFPVYDAPKKEGEYPENMTARPMRRYFKNDPDKPTIEMTLFPEGGELVEGLPCRVAYEVLWEDGEEAGDGILSIDDEGKESVKAAKKQAKDRKKASNKELKAATKKGASAVRNTLSSLAEASQAADTLNWRKYRGTFVVTPSKDMDRTVRFVDRNGHEAKAKLPKPEPEGVALQVDQTDTTWVFNLAFTPGMERDSLGLTIMNEGNVLHVRSLSPERSSLSPDPSPKGEGRLNADSTLNQRAIVCIPKTELREGVNQVTVFDVDGRIWADRLFYNTLPTLSDTHSALSDTHSTLSGDTLPPHSHPSPLGEGPGERLEGLGRLISITFLGTNEDDSAPAASAATQNMPIDALTFAPYQHIRLGVKSVPNSVISLSVRDAAYNDHLYDNADMRTEMLLASEVKGFIPNARWYFEKDDQEHREALDLLLMIQGWRRFNWREMAVPGLWEISQMAESSPVISGHVYQTSDWEYHDFTPEDYEVMASLGGTYNVNNPTTLAYAQISNEDTDDAPYNDTYKDFNALYDFTRTNTALANDNISSALTTDNLTTEAAPINDQVVYNENPELDRRDSKKSKKKNKDLLLHAELVSLDGTETRVTEKMTSNGRFRVLLPGYYGEAVLFLSAADTTTWWSKDKKKQKVKDYAWTQTRALDEDLPEGHKRRFRVDPADYKVLVDFPFPRFVKPYNYYQQHLLEAADKLLGSQLLADGTHQMREVKIGARRGKMTRFTDSIPAIVVDAYQAYNDAIDGGIYYPSPEMIVRNYLGDYGLEFPFKSIDCPPSFSTSSVGTAMRSDPPRQGSNIFLRFGFDVTRRALNNLTMDEDSIYMRGNLASRLMADQCGNVYLSPGEISKYFELQRIEKYIIYTDYQPRLEGSNRYYGSNLPETHIAIYPFADDSRRPVYRDRRYVLKGYAFHDDFYHPNYKNRKLNDEPKDYRRTLYWNPKLQLDPNGQAEVKLYNNGKRGQINVSAEGMAKDGTILGN